jgi:steroid delta-isomerase-like uncharacterized protein
MADTSAQTELRAQREATVQTVVDAINEGDAERAADAFAVPRFELIGLDRVYDGRDNVIGYLHERGQAFPDQRFELIALHHADDAVIAEFWLAGTHLGSVEGLAASGKAFHCRMATFFEFVGRDLVCQRLYFDVGTIARQLA